MKKKIICIILILIIVTSSNILIAFAANKAELEQENSALQNQIDETEKNLGEIENNLTGVMAQIQ